MLERIPIMFLILGAIYAFLGVIAVVMIREPRESIIDDASLKGSTGSEEDFNLKPTKVLRTFTFYQVFKRY